MKIWIMNHYATSMYRDKAGRHYWFAKNLEKMGHKVTIFCASTFLNNCEQIELGKKKSRLLRDKEISFVVVKTPICQGNGIDRVKNMLSFFVNLFPVSKNYCAYNGKPDIVIASSVHPLTMVAGILIARKIKVPCICEIRDLWPEAIFTFGKAREKSILGKILIKGEHWIYKKADALIFTKEGDTDYLKEKGWTKEQGGDIDLVKCHYINNGVDLKAYCQQIDNEIINDNDLNADKFNITYTGTIRPINNIGNIIDCAKIISKDSSMADVQFLIYGDGSDLPKLKERIVNENITNVKIKGFIERKYIPYILSCSSINLLNYSQNQFNWTRGNSSNKLFEYMASGKPIISTVKMGYSIIDKYKCGIELEECTPQAMAEAIKYFHNLSLEEYEQIGINAKEGVKEFDFNYLTDKLWKVIESVKK